MCIRDRDGTVKTYEVPLEMSEVIWKRKKYPIVSKQPVELRLTHEGDRKIAITAKVALVLEMPCDRCLDSVKVPMDLDFERNVDANASSEAVSYTHLDVYKRQINKKKQSIDS